MYEGSKPTSQLEISVCVAVFSVQSFKVGSYKLEKKLLAKALK